MSNTMRMKVTKPPPMYIAGPPFQLMFSLARTAFRSRNSAPARVAESLNFAGARRVRERPRVKGEFSMNSQGDPCPITISLI